MKRTLARSAAAGACATLCLLGSIDAFAGDVGNAGGEDVQLDVTETSIVAQHFDARGNELAQDSGWGGWINRVNALLRWDKWTAGMRLDSAVYWRRSEVTLDNESRFRNSIYPAKMWLTYSAPGLEVTVGDAYAQFGRGLTLSMRKIDELGIDTTVRGAKIEVQKDPFALTVVAGFGNPSRVDEATGRALFVTAGNPSFPLFGSDRIMGAEVQAGRGLPLVLSTRIVRFSRCAPYHYDANANAVTSVTDDPTGVAFGSCSATDTATWLASLPAAPPQLAANDITMVGQSIEVPTIGGHGKLYLEAAGQQRRYDIAPQRAGTDGNALYAALSMDAGPVTSTLEMKSNRNYYPASAGIDLTRAPEFNVVAYSFSPPAETPTILDTEFGYFNACVNGGRARADVRANQDVLLYGQGIFAHTQSEQTSGGCDSQGNTVASIPAAQAIDNVWDGLAGVDWSFDDQQSHVFASAGVRDDTKTSGAFYYREGHVEYSISKFLGGAYSIEFQGRHRRRKEDSLNLDTSYVEQWWHEGENYVAFKVAPKWVFTQGFEYTTLTGQPPYYFNGAVLYKPTSDSNVRLFVGQQRGAFRCAAGICRYFPPFEGARAEVTVRF